MNDILNFEGTTVREVSPSSMLHQERFMPIRAGNGSMFMAYILIKFHVDSEIGLGFVSVLKKVKSNNSHALYDGHQVIGN